MNTVSNDDLAYLLKHQPKSQHIAPVVIEKPVVKIVRVATSGKGVNDAVVQLNRETIGELDAKIAGIAGWLNQLSSSISAMKESIKQPDNISDIQEIKTVVLGLAEWLNKLPDFIADLVNPNVGLEREVLLMLKSKLGKEAMKR